MCCESYEGGSAGVVREMRAGKVAGLEGMCRRRAFDEDNCI